MKRPLAVFGFTYLLVLLVAVRLPAALVLFVALAVAAVFAIAFYMWRKKRWRATAALCTASAGLALALLFGYQQWVMAPLERLAQPIPAVEMQETGEDAPQPKPAIYDALAWVADIAPGYGEETLEVTLQVLELDGVKRLVPIKLQLNGFPEVEIGDLLAVDMEFAAMDRSGLALTRYAKGVYLTAKLHSEPMVVGRSVDFFCAMRILQHRAGDTIRELLPARLSAVAAAMAVGDKRTLGEETKTAYRMAGLSHMLVVSGLHLTILCTALYGVLSKAIRKRRLVAGLCIGAVVLFMVFTGLTPSIMRSGVAFILVYAGGLFMRRADVVTSLGFAALLMCLQNPYAAADVGLLLSFAATLGALTGGRLQSGLQEKAALVEGADARKRMRRVALKAAGMFMVPVLVTFATLPVLLAAGMGFSALGIVMNVIAVPLLAPIVLCSLGMAAFGALPVLHWLARALAIPAGALLVVLEKLTEWCSRVDFLYFYITGAVAVGILLLYPLAFMAWKTRRYRGFALAGCAVLALSVALHFGLRAGTVQVAAAGSVPNPSLVVTSGGKAVVIYRDRRTIWAVQQAMQEQGTRECVLLIDLRRTSQTTEYVGLLQPAEVVIAQEDFFSHGAWQPMPEVEVLVQKQGEGAIACVQAGGYKVGTATGSVNLAPYPMLDVYVAGSGTTAGQYGALLVNRPAPGWADASAALYVYENRAVVDIRPGYSMIIKGGRYGTEGN